MIEVRDGKTLKTKILIENPKIMSFSSINNINRERERENFD